MRAWEQKSRETYEESRYTIGTIELRVKKEALRKIYDFLEDYDFRTGSLDKELTNPEFTVLNVLFALIGM